MEVYTCALLMWEAQHLFCTCSRSFEHFRIWFNCPGVNSPSPARKTADKIATNFGCKSFQFPQKNHNRSLLLPCEALLSQPLPVVAHRHCCASQQPDAGPKMEQMVRVLGWLLGVKLRVVVGKERGTPVVKRCNLAGGGVSGSGCSSADAASAAPTIRTYGGTARTWFWGAFRSALRSASFSLLAQPDVWSRHASSPGQRAWDRSKHSPGPYSLNCGVSQASFSASVAC
eukprot:1156069-Pelagomonas_calceolata.AAC.8